MKKLLCVLAVASAFFSADALAWGNAGHRVVGAMADQLIAGTHAQQQVAALLLPGESLEKIANWPDCVKGNYCGPQTQEMLDYVAANPKHSEYHYTDVPIQDAHYVDGAAGTADDDIVQTLKQAIAVLQGRDDAASNPHHFTQRQALILITHLAGDISQPLHVGAAFVGKDGGFVAPKTRGDIDGKTVFNAQGGNDFLLDDALVTTSGNALIPPAPVDELAKPAAPAATKSTTKPFHSYWDTTVVDYAMRRAGARTPEQYASMLIAARPKVATGSGAPSTWPYQWADDTLAVSKVAHATVTLGAASEKTSSKGDKYTVWALTVPNDYPLPSSTIAKDQLTKGGYRLAALLEAIWP